MFNASVLFQANLSSTADIIVNQGGTSSGKTYSILQVLFLLACQNKIVVTVAGQDIPNLKAGALRDAETIYYGDEENNPDGTLWLKSQIKSYNKSDRIFYFNNGSLIEFKSYDNAQDAKSGKRDYLFVNEANGIDWPVYTELALRTKKKIFIDYNPNSSFWVHEKVIGKPRVELLISDHRHNPFLSQKMRDQIEALKDVDEELWKVYARGVTGKIRGLVFNNWFVCDTIPSDAKLIAYGLDFGFTNDQTGCLGVWLQNGELWVDELLYETGLTNTDIHKRIRDIVQKSELIADSAEPKSIEELRRMGLNVTPAKKGADSIKNGVDILKRYKWNITRRSINLRDELMKYKWKVDRDGKVLNEPIDAFNHLIDPLRYVALNKLQLKNLGGLKKLY